MKTNDGLLIAAVVILIASGCSTLTGPPKAWEQRYYDIQTNTIEMVNWYTNTVTVTNVQKVVVEERVPGTTNVVNVTNEIPLLTYQTNVVSITNVTEEYRLAPNERAKTEIIGTAQEAGGLVGLGQVAGWVATLLVGAWGVVRSRASSANMTTAQTLSQAIEVGAELLKNNPATASLVPAYKQWMQAHQAQTGVLQKVLGILSTSTDNEDARKVADQLIALTKTK